MVGKLNILKGSIHRRKHWKNGNLMVHDYMMEEQEKFYETGV